MTQPNWLDMVPGESLLDWLNRTDTDRVWEQDEASGVISAHLGPIGSQERGFTLRPMFTELEWEKQRDRVLLIPSDKPLVAPVWPGADLVTLGEPWSLVNDLEIESPMHGVLVSVTTPPTRTGLRSIGGRPMDYGVGELAFRTDNGEAEPWQYMGFRDAIYTPKTMAIAGGVLFRVLGGAGGTVTPWTITGS